MQSRTKRLARLGALVALGVFGALSAATADDQGDITCNRWPLCETDLDCEAGSRCWTDQRTVCPAGLVVPCIPGEADESCAQRTQAVHDAHCTIERRASCNPSWSLPCATDADCGAGFTCDGQCSPADPSCTQDSDCPGDWRCGTYDAGYCQAGRDCVNMQRKVIGCLPPLYCAGIFLTGGEDTNEHDVELDESASSDPAGAADSRRSSARGCSLAAPEGPASAAVTLAVCVGLAFSRRRRRS